MPSSIAAHTLPPLAASAGPLGPFYWMLPFAFNLAPLLVIVFGFLLPWAIGFAYVRADANRRGQPGWLWALITLIFGWLAVLVYLAVRALGDTVRA